MPIRRTLKNVVKNYSDAQVKVREATSNDPWGPSSTLMGEIADLTYNVVAFTEIMQMVWKRLNDHGKNWRHVYKSLVVLEYIIKTGSEKVAQQCKENIFAIQTLKDFQHVEDNKDQGVNVREKAKTLVALLKDDERLKNERAKALKAKERFAQNSSGIGSHTTQVQFGKGPGSSPRLASSAGGYSDPYGGARGESASPVSDGPTSNPELEAARPTTAGEEELQLQLALAMSKEEADEEDRKRRGDDVRLQMAMEESEKEVVEQERKRLLQQRQQKFHQQKTPHISKPPGSAPAGAASLVDLDPSTPPPVQASTDPWGSPVSQPVPPGGTDPWGAPKPAPDPWGSPSISKPPAPASSDPWTAPSSNQSTPSVATDPWGPASTTTPTVAASPVTNDPWSTPTSAAAPGFSADPFSSSNGTTAPKTIDDEFDMLSARNTEKSGSADLLGGAGTTNNGDTTGDLFDLGGLGQSLPQENDKKKTPQDFLGGHSNLVNLDNLITNPSGNQMGTNNPFAGGTSNGTSSSPMSSNMGMGMSSTGMGMAPMGMQSNMGMGMQPNPFGAPQQTMPPPMMSQPMGSMNYQMNTPMMPMGNPGMGMNMGMGMQTQSNNPFL